MVDEKYFIAIKYVVSLMKFSLRVQVDEMGLVYIS